MQAKTILPYLAIAALCGCAGGATGGSGVSAVPVTGLFSPNAPGTTQSVYWTLFANCGYPQVQFARVPMGSKSATTNYYCSTENGLSYTSGLTIDRSGHLWVLTFGKSGANPGSVAEFKLPLQPTSRPLHTFVLSGSDGPDALAFDPAGNLWVTSPGNTSVIKYKGPFTKSRTLAAAFTLTDSCCKPFGIAFDKAARLYVSNFNSTGYGSIGILAKPYNGKPQALNGLTAPGGLAFDKDGNLYASTNGSTPALVRYNSDDLHNGDTPSIVDPAGMPAGSYEAAFAFTANGSLYAANCGSSPGINVWPLSRKKFSSTLRPSVLYSNADVQQAGCAWGIAIK